MACGGSIFFLFQYCCEGGTQAVCVQPAQWDDDGGSAGGSAGRYSGLVVAEGDGDERNAFGEGFEDGVESGVGDDGGCALEEFELRGVADDDGIAGEGTEPGGVESASERDRELSVETGATCSDGFESCFGTVLEGAERGIDKRAAVEALPGKIDAGT